MKISDIGQKSVSKVKKNSLKINLNLSLKFSRSSVIWGFFIAIAVVELLVIYGALYKNLTFTKLSQEDSNTAIVRIDFEKYEEVVERLDEVADFQASSFIDFSSAVDDTGRGNPFSDPE